MSDLYDPLTYENLMAGMIVQFEKQPRRPLNQNTSAVGPGIYALFYTGDMDVYLPISKKSYPIYVGKAVPPGSRTGSTAIKVSAPALRDRLRLHGRSIESASNLNLLDFECRCLAVVPVWITLAERFLIDHYRPVWNLRLDGFGNNDQGKARQTVVSWWDTLHPGRGWADRLPRVKTTEEARRRVKEFYTEFEL